MTADKIDWEISGDCTEACTSPTVCPYYWGSSVPTNLHDGFNRCEGAFTFHIREGHYGDIDLDGLNAGICFNSPIGGTAVQDPWMAVLYVDSQADEGQAKALEDIFIGCWAGMGEVIKVKKAPITFSKEPVGEASPPGYKHDIDWQGVYRMKAEPIMTMNGLPRYISGMMGGPIYVGRSTENKLHEPDLERGDWDSSGMSNTYYDFRLNPENLQWVP